MYSPAKVERECVVKVYCFFCFCIYSEKNVEEGMAAVLKGEGLSEWSQTKSDHKLDLTDKQLRT